MRDIWHLPLLALAILAVALVVRVGAVAATPDYRPVTDPADYDRHGEAIARTGKFPATTAIAGGPTAYRPPVYPYFLGAVYKLTGKRWDAARVAQAVVGTLTVALIGLIAWQVWGAAVALVSMAIAAVFPPLVVVGSALLSEQIALPLQLGAVAAVLAHRRSPVGYRWLIGAGVLAGLAALTRPNMAILVPVLAIGAWTVRPLLSRRALAAPAVLVAASVLTIAPWTIRNVFTMDAFIPVSTQLGYTLAGTYNDVARHDAEHPAAWVEWWREPHYADIALRARTEVGAEKALRHAALEYAEHHPDYVAEVGVRNMMRMFHLAGRDETRFDARIVGIEAWLADVGFYSFFPLAALALLGLTTAARRQAPRFLWLVPLALLSVPFFAGYVRFRAAIDPFLILLGALALLTVWRRLRSRGLSA